VDTGGYPPGIALQTADHTLVVPGFIAAGDAEAPSFQRRLTALQLF